jgi:hypothetical protein
LFFLCRREIFCSCFASMIMISRKNTIWLYILPFVFESLLTIFGLFLQYECRRGATCLWRY